MSYNWNVYKVFKNGNRAKAPVTTFESDEIAMKEHFNNVIKKNFSGKFADANYHIIRADLPQEENLVSEEEKFSKEKNRVLGRLVAQQNIDYKYKVGASLVYCRESEWKWQWAVVGAATSKYLAALSPGFKKYGGGTRLDPRSYGVEKELEAIPKGTLVRVAITNLAEPPTYCMGVVIEESIKNNQTLFPSVVVYNLETKKITREFLGTLKVISKN